MQRDSDKLRYKTRVSQKRETWETLYCTWKILTFMMSFITSFFFCWALYIGIQLSQRMISQSLGAIKDSAINAAQRLLRSVETWISGSNDDVISDMLPSQLHFVTSTASMISDMNSTIEVFWEKAAPHLVQVTPIWFQRPLMWANNFSFLFPSLYNLPHVQTLFKLHWNVWILLGLAPEVWESQSWRTLGKVYGLLGHKIPNLLDVLHVP